MSRKIIVTGGAGLIGFSVAKRLCQDGHDVVAMDRVAPAEDGDFNFVLAELTDAHKIHEIAADNVDAIIHCGAVSGPMLGRDNPRAVVDANVVGTANVLEVARQRGMRRVVYCSSTSAYGDTATDAVEPVSENAPLAASDMYGATKAAGDLLTRAYAAQHGVDAVVLRFCWVFGPRRRTPCVLRDMIKDAQAGRQTTLSFGHGFYRQYVFIDDVVDALLAALNVTTLSDERAFNITSGTRLNFGDIAEVVRQVLPTAQIKLGDDVDEEDQVHAQFDIAGASKFLGWTPRLSFKDGVKAYADWLSAHPV